MTGTQTEFSVSCLKGDIIELQYTTLQNNTSENSDRNTSAANRNNLDKRKKTDVLSFISSGHKR